MAKYAFTRPMLGLDSNWRVQHIVGYNAQTVSTPQIEYRIGQYDKKDDAVGYIYHQEGHTFYVLTFPTESKTWCYDLTTRVWHERSSGTFGERNRSNCHAWFNGKNYVGDFENGNIYELDLDTYTDAGDTIIRKRSSQTVENGRKRLFHSRFEIEFEAGVGLTTGQGSESTAVIEKFAAF